MAGNPDESICLDCGMCCDGTFLDYAPVTVDEAAVLEPKGLPVILVDGFDLRFQQPCKKFDSCCNIYDDRPSVCRKFRCRLLKSTDKGRTDSEMALQTIRIVKTLKAELSQLIPDTGEKSYFRQVRDFMLEIENSGLESRKAHARTLMLGTRFMNLINDEFIIMRDEIENDEITKAENAL